MEPDVSIETRVNIVGIKARWLLGLLFLGLYCAANLGVSNSISKAASLLRLLLKIFIRWRRIDKLFVGSISESQAASTLDLHLKIFHVNPALPHFLLNSTESIMDSQVSPFTGASAQSE
ncbi:hypothetical protein LIER_23520 [Lithospermum erythrorhizon]|uniref:Uncharacterized protein n=1 Tax=Lithospermum erythrorhizon TaxID=34254 RepID=A0AAV3R3I5_LITER